MQCSNIRFTRIQRKCYNVRMEVAKDATVRDRTTRVLCSQTSAVLVLSNAVQEPSARRCCRSLFFIDGDSIASRFQSGFRVDRGLELHGRYASPISVNRANPGLNRTILAVSDAGRCSSSFPQGRFWVPMIISLKTTMNGYCDAKQLRFSDSRSSAADLL